MKKTLLSILALGISAVMSATAPEYLNHYLIDGPNGQDISSKVRLCPDGSFLTLSHFGTITDGEAMTFDGETVAYGAATTSTSDNRNLLLIKHNADGKKQWVVYSKAGYIDVASNADVCVGTDGSVVMLLNVRCSDGNGNDDLVAPVLVDASGAETEFPDWNRSAKIFNQIVVKLNASGYVQWVKTVAMDQLPVPEASSGNSATITVNAVTPYCLQTDANGNIYIGGNYRAPMIFTGAKNSVYVLQPRNLKGYNGDVQQSAGGAYLVKLDGEGNYLTHLRVSGEAKRDQINAMVVSDGSLYFTGNVQGTEGQTLTLGKYSFSLTNALDGLMVGAVSTDAFTPLYFNLIPATANSSSRHTTQCKGMQMIDGSLYIYGLVTGGFLTAPGGSEILASSNTQLQGFAIRINAAEGTVTDGVCNKLGIGGYLGAFKYKDNLYFYGYQMNATMGAYLDEYASTGAFATPQRYSLIAGGGAPTAYSCAFNEKSTQLYTIARGNNVFKFGTVESAKPQNWSGVLGIHCFDRNAATTIETVVGDNNLTVTGETGKISFVAEAPTQISVVNTVGQNVYSAEIPAGNSSVTVPAGLYIVNTTKVVVR
ncbi:MAG: hypothetical protein Q4F07_07985 [Bacteroidales bacterium]|nr:hypothetical protein [Bacteroidales bacterium]